MTQTTKETADQDKDEQYILDELAYAVERDSWFEINGRSSTILQAMLKSKDAEIDRLRDALQKILNSDTCGCQMECVDMCRIAEAALKETE